jgi:hypothetical protein
VDAAVDALDGHMIANGYRISVSRADFSHKEAATVAPLQHQQLQQQQQEQQQQQAQHQQEQAHEDHSNVHDVELDAEQLPIQCDAEHYPVVVLHNVYTVEEAATDPDEFFTELEGDMLQECVRHGNVRRVVTLEVRTCCHLMYKLVWNQTSS